jgi:hypothetical protein
MNTPIHTFWIEFTFLQLTPEAQKQAEEDSSLDEFQRVKKRCARQVQDIRKAITERDELLEKVGGSANKTTVEMSARVRTQLRSLREDAEKLKEIQIAEEKKAAKAKKPDAKAAAAEKVDHRKEVVDLVFSHMEECETLEKKRLNVAGAAGGGAARSNLLANGGKASYAQVPYARVALHSPSRLTSSAEKTSHRDDVERSRRSRTHCRYWIHTCPIFNRV